MIFQCARQKNWKVHMGFQRFGVSTKFRIFATQKRPKIRISFFVWIEKSEIFVIQKNLEENQPFQLVFFRLFGILNEQMLYFFATLNRWKFKLPKTL
jgi:hypothetical protein